MGTQITNHVHRHVGEPHAATSAALQRLKPLQPLRDALMALGLAERVSVHEAERPAPPAPATVSFILTWRLAEGSCAHVAWTLSVTSAGDGDSMLSASIRAGTTATAADRQLVAAWPVLGRIVDAHTTRLLATVTRLAEELTENGVDVAPARLLAAA